MTVYADVMIPSIAGHVVVMFVLLLPISLIEAGVLAMRHQLEYHEACRLSFRANLQSTVVGLPLGYVFAFLGIIPAGLFAALLPERIRSVLGRIIMGAIGIGGTIPNPFDEIGFYLGTLLVMIPYFLVTLRLEKRCIAKLRPDLDDARMPTTVRIMNDVTYGLLAIPILIGAIGALLKLANSSYSA